MPFEENLHNKFYYILIQKYCSKNKLKLNAQRWNYKL